jgi:4-amino-4-deoxy-L-arabinose transferase-like glycosyltransferase
MKIFKNKTWLVLSLIILVYLALHLAAINKLPVFADEAIYIRWAQLIIDDWRQYLFFPLNDGKTPIFIWLLVPFQFIFTDQLIAGRVLALLAGVAQLLTVKQLAQELQLKPISQWLAVALTALLPFWFFHHQMALIDGMLTLWLSLSLLFIIKAFKHIKDKLWLRFSLVAGLFFGLGLLTKLPALLFAPTLAVLAFCWDIKKPITKSTWVKRGLIISIVLVLGFDLFALLKLHPAFGQLFSRGSDFLFPWKEVLLHQGWRSTLPSWPNYLYYLGQYLTWPILILSLLGLLTNKKSQVLALHLSWIIFAGPIFLLGKVVYPRYLLPVSIFLTLAATVSFDELIKKRVVNFIAWFLVAVSLICSGRFIYLHIFQPTKLNLVSADKTQYLYEWSAGYGVKETVNLISELKQKQNVLVLTEGYFGTLPDGLLMYFHQENVENMHIVGIGQPIRSLPSNLNQLTDDVDQILLVANSHRIHINLDRAKLLLEVCRPDSNPCHQVWDVTPLYFSN